MQLFRSQPNLTFDDTNTQLGANTYPTAIAALDSRVDTAETEIVDLDTRLDNSSNAIALLDNRLDIAEPAIDSLDSRLDVIEATILPIAPGTTILFDPVAGDDSNDGFNNAVQTTEKLQEILDGHDWQKQGIVISVLNPTTILLSGIAEPNFASVDLDCNNNTFVVNIVCEYFKVPLNLYNCTLQGAGRIGFNSCSYVSLTLSLNSISGFGSLVTFFDCDLAAIGIQSASNINVANLDLFACTDCKNVQYTSGAAIALTRVRNFFSLIRVENFEITVGSITLATGRLFDASAAPFVNIAKLLTSVSSLADIYPTVYVYNNQTVIKPQHTTRIFGLVPALNTDTTKWEIGIGEGQIVDAATNPATPVVRKVERTSVLVVNKPTQLNGVVTSVYAYYYWTGTAIALNYQTTAPVADDLIDKLFLCSIISLNGINISEVRPINLPDEPLTKSLLNRGLGINLDNVFPTPIASTARLAIAAQKVIFAGRWHHLTPKTPHTATLAAVSPIQYYLVNPTTGEPFAPLTLQTDFNFNRVWNGTALVALSNPSNFSVQFIYRYPNGAFLVVPGINEYTSLQFASTLWHGVETLRFPSSLKSNCIYIGAIAGRGNLTNIASNNPTTGQALLINNYVQS